MKAIRVVYKIVSDNISFLKSQLHLKVTEALKLHENFTKAKLVSSVESVSKGVTLPKTKLWH